MTKLCLPIHLYDLPNFIKDFLPDFHYFLFQKIPLVTQSPIPYSEEQQILGFQSSSNTACNQNKEKFIYTFHNIL